MGWLIWPDLTNEAVVCQGKCEHRDCAAWRAQDPDCVYCGKELQAGDAFYYVGERVAHRGCHIEYTERHDEL